MPFQKALLHLKSPKLSSNVLLINPDNKRGPFAEVFQGSKGRRKARGWPCLPTLAAPQPRDRAAAS